ncbi:MAG: hypothetical protein V4564_13475 [Pseudomonadota bacterium]|uniref:hypothetical protein n=1 Tax=Sphingomonas sp. ERG5 TaxID=1381597 RepID=UPI0009DD847A|nr:hypothetical protein [Sphingomonas sp. ERG5]
MRWLDKLLGKKPEIRGSDEPLVPHPIPALVTILHRLEQDKGTPLTEAEVVSARDQAVCIMLPVSKAAQLAEKRGYDDVDLENVWESWCQYRTQITTDGE